MKTILDNVQPEDVYGDPFPHLAKQNVIDEETCRRLIEEYPSVEILTKGRPYGSNERITFSTFDVRNHPNISPFWREFVEAQCSQQFLDNAMRIFKDHVLKHYPDFEEKYGKLDSLRAGVRKVDTFETADVLLDAQICVNTPTLIPSSVRGPHLDNPDKFLFGLFYLRHPEDKSEGGELLFYTYKDMDAVEGMYNHGKNTTEENLELVRTVPYRNNQLFLALNGWGGVHGVSVRGVTKYPRLFLNLVMEVREDLFKAPIESRTTAFLKRNNFIKKSEHTNKKKTIKEFGFFDTKKSSVLVANPKAVEDAFPALYEKYNILFLRDIHDKDDELIKSIEAVIIGKGGEKIPEDLLLSLPNLKVVGIGGGSPKKYAPQKLLEKNIQIVNTSEAYADAVSEYTIMAMLLGLRNASRSNNLVKEGRWGFDGTDKIKRAWLLFHRINRKVLPGFISRFTQKILSGAEAVLRRVVSIIEPQRDPLLGKFNAKKRKYNTSKKTLTGARVGIVGFGPITRKLVALLKPFKCDIFVYSEYLTSEDEQKYGITKAIMPEVCDCDVVTIHRGLSERTRKSFGKKEIAMMKPGTVLVNSSRGEIIDEKALIDRLNKKDIFAVLDVFEKEPLPKKHPLRNHPNVFATPHIGTDVDATYKHANESLARDVVALLEGKSAQSDNVISAERLATMT